MPNVKQRDGQVRDHGAQPGTGLFLCTAHGWEQGAAGPRDVFLGDYWGRTKGEAKARAQAALDRWKQEGSEP